LGVHILIVVTYAEIHIIQRTNIQTRMYR